MLKVRPWQILLIAATLGLSWMLMMAVHELGHVLHAWLSGGTVERVVLHPLMISRTDILPNPHPQFVAWGGAVWGIAIPLLLLVGGRLLFRRQCFLLAFFAGFCCLANGLYLAVGSFEGIGDAGDLLRHGAKQWQLVAFGMPTALLGLGLWNGLGPRFGFGNSQGNVDHRLALWLVVALAAMVAMAVVLSAR